MRRLKTRHWLTSTFASPNVRDGDTLGRRVPTLLAVTLTLSAACTFAACKNRETGGSPPAPVTQEHAEAGTTNVTAAPTPASAPAARAWTVNYQLRPGTVYIPTNRDWASVRLKSDETKLLGPGTLSLSIDPTRRVTGTITTGPLSPATLEGRAEDSHVRASVIRTDSGDEGLSGTLIAELKGNSLQGTIRVSDATSAIVRVADFETAPVPP